MLTLTIRTDKPEAELGLYNGAEQLAYISWQAHRELAETIHHQLKKLLADNSRALDAIQSLVVYQGPGSFTGLRIGISVANALAESLAIPIVAAGGDAWTREGISKLEQGRNDRLVMPQYSAPPNTTTPKK